MKDLQRLPCSTSFDLTRSKPLKHSRYLMGNSNLSRLTYLRNTPVRLPKLSISAEKIWARQITSDLQKKYFWNRWNYQVFLSISVTSNVQIWRGSFGILCYAKVIWEMEWISTKWNHHILNWGPSECYNIQQNCFKKW